jgi:GTP pyrophosphokinase
LDESTIAAGLLHESLQQNGGLRSQLEEFMSSEVVQMVDRVTTISEISQLYRNHRDEVNDEKLCRMMLAMEDVRAVLIKLACRVHNLKTLSGLSEEKQRALAQETLDIFAVVANRLGCWSLKAELEDLSFAVLYPEEYSRVKCMVSSRQDSAALFATVQAIKAGLEERGIQYEEISGRPKNLYGIWQKMNTNNATNVDKIYDVIALRVVVSGNKHDCYQAQRVVQGLYRCMPERSKDFIRVIKKANGYQSLHETIYGEEDLPVEVQIRTSKMHYIAEYGFAAHWKYKECSSSTDDWLDKEVQYKKWLMSYGLGMHDKKIRPVGSPPTDSSLKSLGAAYLEPSTSNRRIPSGVRPRSAPGRVDPFLRHDRFKLEQPAPRSVVTVVLQTQDSVEPREVTAGLTAQQLVTELGVEYLPGYIMMLNQRLVFPHHHGSAASPLRDGDLVQVLPLSQVMKGLQAAGENPHSSILSIAEESKLQALLDSSVEPQSGGFHKRSERMSRDELNVFSIHSLPNVLVLSTADPAPLQVMASHAVPVGGY